MKKMRFIMVLMSIVAFATVTFASCEKTEDVNFNDTQIPVVIDYSKSATPGIVPCSICQWDSVQGVSSSTCGHGLTVHMVNPGECCRHIFHKEEACPYGVYCSHYGKCHYHQFNNLYHDGNTHFDVNTHCGGTVHSHGHATH